MAKLTKAQVRDLHSALSGAKAARLYLDSDRTAVCHRDSMATRTTQYVHRDGDALEPMEKWVGSDLVRLDSAIRTLEAFLDEHYYQHGRFA